MNKRRQFLFLLGAGGLSLAEPAWTNQVERKIARVGVLASGNLTGTPQYEAFRRGMQEHGWVEGNNFSIEHRWTDQDVGQLPALARELVELPVDVILAWGTPAVAAARQATATVPIVMIAVADPVAQGFVTSLAKPGGNITGMSNRLLGNIAKNVEMLVRVRPGAKRIAILANPGNGSHALVLQEAQAAARDHGVHLDVLAAATPAEIERVIPAIRPESIAGMVIIGDPMFMQQRARIAELALQKRLPTTTIFRQYPEAGGLMSYGLNSTDMFRREAYFVDKILRGTKPGDLPVEHPTTYEMVINLKTARAIGIQIPESVVLRADKVIE